MSESDNLLVRIQLEARISEREGMIAENKIRESRGEAMAYNDQPKPGSVFCLRCRHLGERVDERNAMCDRPEFRKKDCLGGDTRPLCSYINASNNCNGFEEKP